MSVFLSVFVPSWFISTADRKDTLMHLSKPSLLLTLLLASGTAMADETDANITYREDVVYGRVHGAGLLADIASPKSNKPLPVIISVHGGRWRGGHKKDGSTIKVQQWAEFGFFAMSIDYRLVGASPAPHCISRYAMRDPLRACQRQGAWRRHRPHFSHRSIGRRAYGFAGRHTRRRPLATHRWLG